MSIGYEDVRKWDDPALDAQAGVVGKRRDTIVGLQDELDRARNLPTWQGMAAFFARASLGATRDKAEHLVAELSSVQRALQVASDDVRALTHRVKNNDALAAKYEFGISNDGAIVDNRPAEPEPDSWLDAAAQQVADLFRDGKKEQIATEARSILAEARAIDAALTRALQTAIDGKVSDYGATSLQAAADSAEQHAEDEAPTGGTNRDRSDDELYPGGQPEPDDINQGALGDCWVLAALAATARSNPEKIESLITDNHDGTFTVHFPGGDVTVDEYALSDQGGSAGGHAKWVSIVETAYAEREGGDYEGIDGGFPDAAMRDLFGAETDTFDPNDGMRWPFGTKSTDDSLDAMRSAIDAGRPVTATVYDELGFDGGHALTVIDVDEAKDTVTIRNPWGYNSRDTIQAIEDVGGRDLGGGVMELPDDKFSDVCATVSYVTSWS